MFLSVSIFESVFASVLVSVFVSVLEPLAKWLPRLVLEEFAPAVKLGELIIEAGNDQDPDNRADEHAASSRGADGSVPDRPGAGDRKSTRLNSSHLARSRMPSSA